jgi:hypothetical protein
MEYERVPLEAVPTILGPLGNRISLLHSFNYSIWHLEDLCRGNNDAVLVSAKRQIDSLQPTPQ